MSLPAWAPSQEIKWLTCRIVKGMFSDERAVTYPAKGESEISVFVPASDVDGAPGSEGRVRVRVVRNNGYVMAVLPSANPEIVAVDEEDLSPI